MTNLVLASNNPGKLKEIETILSPLQCIPQQQLGINEAIENGLSFIENALIKARHACEQSGKPALADDSGLVVPELMGEPGIYSSRFAGAKASDMENISLLLQKMLPLKSKQREAYFYCAIVLMQHPKDPTPLIATGLFHGLIALTPSGTGGFGYDPIFYLPTHQCTAAELPATIKNKISHRAKALEQLRQLAPLLK